MAELESIGVVYFLRLHLSRLLLVELYLPRDIKSS